MTACNCAYMSWIFNFTASHYLKVKKKKFFLKHLHTRPNKLHQKTEMVWITRWLTPEPSSFILCMTHVAPLLKFLRNGGIICNKALPVLSLTPTMFSMKECLKHSLDVLTRLLIFNISHFFCVLEEQNWCRFLRSI